MSRGEAFGQRAESSLRPMAAGGRSSWKVAAVVMAVIAAAVLLLSGLVAIGVWRGWPARLSTNDREVLFVAAELGPYFDFVLRNDGEQFSKRRYFNGRMELSYRYQHPDPEAAFQLASRVIVAPTRAEARSNYQRLADQLDAAGHDAGYKFEERPSFAWGDAIRYGVLLDGDAVAGHVLACRKGEKLFCLELSGVGLDDSQWGELISAAMQSLESYQP